MNFFIYKRKDSSTYGRKPFFQNIYFYCIYGDFGALDLSIMFYNYVYNYILIMHDNHDRRKKNSLPFFLYMYICTK